MYHKMYNKMRKLFDKERPDKDSSDLYNKIENVPILIKGVTAEMKDSINLTKIAEEQKQAFQIDD